MSLHEHPLDVPLDSGAEFRTWVDTDAHPPIVGVAGELDLLTCAPFRDALSEACAAGSSTVVLDFGQLHFIASTGLREIVRALAQTSCIEIRSPSPAVRKVLEMFDLGPRVVIRSD